MFLLFESVNPRGFAFYVKKERREEQGVLIPPPTPKKVFAKKNPQELKIIKNDSHDSFWVFFREHCDSVFFVNALFLLHSIYRLI